MSKKVSQYAKFAVAMLGFVVTLATSFVATFGAHLPASAVAWITTAISIVTAASVWLAKNEPIVEEVGQAIENFGHGPGK